MIRSTLVIASSFACESIWRSAVHRHCRAFVLHLGPASIQESQLCCSCDIVQVVLLALDVVSFPPSQNHVCSGHLRTWSCLHHIRLPSLLALACVDPSCEVPVAESSPSSASGRPLLHHHAQSSLCNYLKLASCLESCSNLVAVLERWHCNDVTIPLGLC